MNPDEEALRRVVRILEQRGIPYMLTGSVATSYHGRPRATHDADIVIERSDAPLTHAGGGIYRGTGQLSMGGTWRTSLSVVAK